MGKIILWGMVVFLTACSSGNCRRIHSTNTNAKGKATPKAHLFVYKYDGSQQCKMGQAIKVEEMEKELSLKKIKVFSKKNEHDGLMHIQVCGSPTGQANVYEIHEKDLATAQALGFKKWEKTK